ncbi:MAG: lipid A biosynthesis acyltransferase [Chitinophagales bacterium]|nr:lipid A biosynthesis acyltransferase [Chitinophagales bacterium]
MRSVTGYVLWLLSHLPFAFFHALSWGAARLLYYVIGYRKEVVLHNLAIAFPDLSEAKRKEIAKAFYLRFTDTFLESIKMLSLSNRQALRRVTLDLSVVEQLLNQGRSVQLMVAHQFNWEYINLTIPVALRHPFYFVYRPIGNKVIDQLYLWQRTRLGGNAVSADQFAEKRDLIFSRPSVLALGADQNPGKPEKACWLPFFGTPAPFYTGPAKGAIQYNAAMVMLQMERTKRGHYRFTTHLLSEHPAQFSAEQLTLLYKCEVERIVKADPANYLWSHRRWRHVWQPAFGLYTGE